MNIRSATTVVLRIMGWYMIFRFLLSVASWMWVLEQASTGYGRFDPSGLPFFWVESAFCFVVALALLIWPARIAGFLTRGLTDESEPSERATCEPRSSGELLRLGLGLLGAYVLVYAIPNLVGMIAAAALEERFRPRSVFATSDFAHFVANINLGEFLRAFLETALGIWLLMGGKGIARLIIAAKTAGAPPENAGGSQVPDPPPAGQSES